MNTSPLPTWIETWFNSPYYHLLYQHRDEDEARLLIEQLANRLQIPPQARVLDLACGKGRHARYLAQLGFDVVGLDLSPDSITAAKHFETPTLRFEVQDMRSVFKENYFQYVFNFFTSFGFFEHTTDNAQTLAAIYRQLQPGGWLVLDFFNTNNVIAKLVAYEEKEIDGVRFFITRRTTAHHIIKTISVIDEQRQFKATYEERVQALTLQWFEKALHEAGFTLTETWGDYQLNPYHPQQSKRLLLLAQKA